MTERSDADISSAIRAISFALQVGDSGVWGNTSNILRVRLDAHQRAALAWASLRSLDPDQADKVAEFLDYFPGGSGSPMNPTGDPADEAQRWIATANADEIDAYAVATFLAMSPERRAEFLTFAQGVVAA